MSRLTSRQKVALLSLLAVSSLVTPVLAGVAPAEAAGFGTVSLSGAVEASYTIDGMCSAHATVLTTVTLRTQAVNGTTVTIAGSTLPPPQPVNLASTTSFNVEVEIISGPGAGGRWLAGYAGGPDLGAGALVVSPSANSGSVEATLDPYAGGTYPRPIELKASWNCAAPQTPAQTNPSSGGTTDPVTLLMSHVPSSYFGCTSDPELNLGGESTIFRYKAVAEVDCEVEGVNGVNLVIYMLYPNDKAMSAAFEHVWVDKVAQPRTSLGCPLHSFATAVCDYRIGNSRATAGEFVRFLLVYAADPNPTPSITWTSNRYSIISYISGAEPDDTQQVLDYWESGAPGPV